MFLECLKISDFWKCKARAKLLKKKMCWKREVYGLMSIKTLLRGLPFLEVKNWVQGQKVAFIFKYNRCSVSYIYVLATKISIVFHTVVNMKYKKFWNFFFLFLFKFNTKKGKTKPKFFQCTLFRLYFAVFM